MLLTLEQASRAIRNGEVLSLAADETLLSKLPKGAWIGGTIPYFMAEDGGQISRDKIFATRLPCASEQISIRTYATGELPNVLNDAPDNGFSIVIIPALSEAHSAYARSAPGFDGMFLKPIIGWISGVHLDDLGKISPKVFDGRAGRMSSEHAVVLHASLPDDKIANMGIVNLFSQGDGDMIKFPQTGFSASRCFVNGREQNFADYLTDKKIDTRLPLVADYCGAMVNVSFQGVDQQKKTVSFYAPVFDDVEYRIAQPISDYVSGFQSALPRINGEVSFSCNCILNFLYSELEGKKTANMTGPMTFGEVAYQLLNQTMVYMVVQDNY
ncbi:MAG: DUF6976 family protein [Gammaproteobacteria bacterium]